LFLFVTPLALPADPSALIEKGNYMKVSRLKILILLTATLAFARNSKIAADLEGVDPSANVDIIVRFRQAPSDAQHYAIRARGGRHKSDLRLIKGGLYSVPAARLKDLAGDPAVEYIAPDRPVTAFGTNLAPDYKLAAVNADIAQQYGWDGTGIGIAVIDSGIQDRPDLHGPKGYRVVYAENFGKGGSAVDVYGHGTHVAGIAAGSGGQSQGVFAGVAPNASLINLMVLDQTGAATDSIVIAAIQRAIQLKSTYNIRVINLSLGRPVFESYTLDPLCQAVEAAWKAGIVVVVAAGNYGRNNSANAAGYATITAPGNDPYVITVGAMKTAGTPLRSDDYIASYSSKGPTLFDHVVKPDLVAPGNRIVSILGNNAIAQQYQANMNGAYLVLSGTSMATPIVSGAVALLLQQSPSLTPDLVKARLMKTASKSFPLTSTVVDPITGVVYTSQYDIFTIGAGYLDIWAALASTGFNVVWGDNVVWGSSNQTTVENTNILFNGEN
jgi:serine protease AprX